MLGLVATAEPDQVIRTDLDNELGMHDCIHFRSYLTGLCRIRPICLS